MSTPQRAPRSRSAFGAAFLSLVFPGLGHAYAGAYTRALGFAAAPLLLVALGLGAILRIDKGELIGYLADGGVLTAIFVVNLLAFIYRIAAAIDAWQVARFLNAGDAGGGRLGRARLPINPISVAGLLAVILVISVGHVAVARYDLLGKQLVDCVFTEDPNPACEQPSGDASPGPSDEPLPTDEPGVSFAPDASATDDAPTPNPSAVGTLAPTLPPWDGTDRLNILAVGVDARGSDPANSFNTDTMIVISIDPVSKQVAMFQVPRDMVDVPVPPNAQALWGTQYRGKINSWYNQNRGRTDLWPGGSPQARGFAALKALLGQLYGLDIRYYVKVDFGGFRDAVNTLGGLQVNVQMPVYESLYPSGPGFLQRLYIPAGPQHMNGAAALRYARSRHRATDFDRGRRQQRVLISLKDQTSIQAILANLDELIKDVGRSVKTDIPASALPKMLSLADKVDTKNVRSFVFAPPLFGFDTTEAQRGYIIEPYVARIRRAVREAFSVSADVLAQRDRLGEEGAKAWVLNASGRSGLSSDNADWLAYSGVDASAPNQRVPNQLAKTEIKVYNGAETKMPETVKFLESVYNTTVVPVTDPSVSQDFVITLGRDAPDKQVDAVG